MTGAASLIAEAFGEDALSDVYGIVLNIQSAKPSSLTGAKLRKAYHKRALQYHPDKLSSASAEEAEDAKRKFQAVSAAYQILSDEEKRKVYDETGDLLDDDGDDFGSNDGDGRSAFEMWMAYFRSTMPKVTTKDIDNYAAKYRYSEEERQDVLKYYKTCKGDLNQMVSCVPCSDVKDKPRWVKDFLNPAMKKGDISKEFQATMQETLGVDPDDEEDEEEDEDYVDEVDEKSEDEDDDLQEDSDDQEDQEKDQEQDQTRSKQKRTKSKRQSSSSSKKPRPTRKKPQPKPTKPSSSKKTKLTKKEREAKEAEELIAAIRGRAGNDENDINGVGGALAKKRREEAFNGLLKGLEDRYTNTNSNSTGNKKKKRKKATQEDISEEEFEKLQAKMFGKNKGKGSKARA